MNTQCPLKTRWDHAKKSRSGSPHPKWKPSWRKLKLAAKERAEQALIAEKLHEWDFQQTQERLDEALKVYTRGFQAGSSGDDFVRGWESTKVQILGLRAA